ncbi:MAG: DNA starvation/stationary phase protection protein [Clostridia bacterium]|nr:DNA starvation/stationary phase protection protein [Clostridium sp.]
MEKMVNELNELLADLNIFYRKLQNFHWNIQGKEFFVLHAKLEEYYNDVNLQVDEIAEHILMLGKEPLGTMKEYLEVGKIKEATSAKVEEKIVLESLLKDYETLLQKVICIKKEADNSHIYGTSALMDSYILNYSKTIWMLKQTMVQ